MSVPPFVQLAQDVIEGNKSYEDAEKVFKSLLLQGQVDLFDVVALQHKGMYEHAIICLNLLKTIFIKSGPLYAESAAVMSNYLGFFYMECGDYNKAEDNFLYAKKAALDHKNNNLAIRCTINIANIYTCRGLFEEAIERLKSLRNTIQGNDDFWYYYYRLVCDRALADAYMRIGSYDIARKFNKSVDEQLKIIKSSPSLLKKLSDEGLELNIEIAYCNLFMANIEWYENFYDKSIELYTKARIAYAENNRPVLVAHCDTNIAAVYAFTGQDELALSKYREAKAAFNEANMVVSIAECEMKEAMLLAKMGKIDDAFELLNLARSVFDDKDITTSVAKCDRNAATLYCVLGDEKESLGLLQSSQSFYLKKGRILDAAECDLGLALISSNRKDYSTAIELYNRVLNIYRDDPNIKSICFAGLGYVYMYQGKTADAYVLYKDAIEQIEAIRGSIANNDMRSSFLGEKSIIYQDMVACCIKLKDFNKAIEYVERLKSRNLAELIAHKNLLPKFALEEEKHEYQRLRFRMKALAHQLSKEEHHDRSINIKEELEKAERKHDQMVLNFRTKDLQFDPDQRIIITYEDIKSLINDPDSALIELFPMQDKTVVFVISQNGAIEKNTELSRSGKTGQ